MVILRDLGGDVSAPEPRPDGNVGGQAAGEPGPTPRRLARTSLAGVFAADATLRAAVTALVPGPVDTASHVHAGAPSKSVRPRASRLPWAELFRRVFRADLLVCPRCTGPVQVLAAITDPDVVTAILTHLGLPTEPAPLAAARAPPQAPLWPGALDPRPDLDAYDPA